MPTTTITFNGLLVFHYDPRAKQFEVGVLRARAKPHSHILNIEGTFESAAGDGDLDVPTSAELESIVKGGNVEWHLDVELNGQVLEGLVFNAAEPANRLDPSPNDDFGWVINIESGRFHGRPLPRTPKRLQPVILLKKGRLFTTCKTDSVDTIRGGNEDTATELGFIAGGISLSIDTSAGEQAVLRANKETIFICEQTDQRDYSISIMNTPMSGMAGGHFHLFYDRLFQQVAAGDRFDLGLNDNGLRPDDRCPEGRDTAPDPFKCGGIRIDDGGGSLG